MGQGVIYHKALAASGEWAALGFSAQMANIGSEVSRAVKWKEKGRDALAQKAFARGLELLDFTRRESSGARLRELSREREVLCDYFAGANDFGSTKESIQKYFDDFAFAIRK